MIKGCVYSIECRVTGKRYIGSTKKTLIHRLKKHCECFKSWKSGKGSYVTAYEVLESNEYEIILLKEVIVESKKELEKIERYYIETLECVNRIIPTRSRTEWYEQNKDKLKKYYASYCEQHKEELREKKRRYHKENKGKISNRHAQYHQENKDRINEKAKKYREENKEMVREKAREKVQCTCGDTYTKGHKARHEKSQKHLASLS
jgi:hypothetical protein